MSPRSLYRWAAVALAVTGLSLAIGVILHPRPPFSGSIATSQWAVSHFFWWLGAMAGIAGVAGLYLRQREEVGILGFAGSGLAVFGLSLIGSSMYFEAFIAPSIAARAPELFDSYPAGGGWEGFLAGVLGSGALFGIGFLLFGISMLRAQRLPRWAIIFSLIGGIPFAVNFLLPHPVAILAAGTFGAGLIGLAVGLWQSVEASLRRQTDVTET